MFLYYLLKSTKEASDSYVEELESLSRAKRNKAMLQMVQDADISYIKDDYKSFDMNKRYIEAIMNQKFLGDVPFYFNEDEKVGGRISVNEVVARIESVIRG